MTKWEYLYAGANNDELEVINGQPARQSALLTGINKPSVSDFLRKAGQEGWEVVGICLSNGGAFRWRLVLKRPLS